MSSSQFVDILKAIGALNSDIARCLAGIGRITQMYADMRREVDAALDDSLAYADEVASLRKRKRTEGLSAALAKCQEYVDYIQGLHDGAKDQSKAYARTYTETRSGVATMPFAHMETLDQCQGKLYSLSADAKEAHQLTIGASGIGGMVGAVSGKSKRQHIKLIEIADAASSILKQAESIALDMDRAGDLVDEGKREESVREAKRDTESLLKQIGIREQEDTARIVADFTAKLAKRIPASVIADITELEGLMPPNADIDPSGTSEHVLLGSYAYGIEAWPFVGNAEALDSGLRSVFGGWYENGFIIAPAILDRAQISSVFFCGNEKGTRAAMASFILAELEANPAPEQKFILVNPTGERMTFEPFLAAAKNIPEIFGDGILTERRAIADALDNAVAAINERSQRLLIGYRDVFEFNAEEETADLPLLTICAALPLGFLTEQMRESIESIVRNGSACGVSIALALDVDECDVDETAKFLALLPNAFIEWADDSGDMTLGDGIKVIHDRADSRRVAAILPRLEDQVRKQKSQSVGLEAVLPRELWFEGDSTYGVSIPMGKTADVQRIALEFGPQVGNGISHFGLLIGSTGSGKSSFLHSVILSSLLKYSPDELQLYLLDFKSGIEFDVYSKFRIPHLRLLALDAMQAFGHSVLIELREQMDERNRLFSEVGVQNLEDYRVVSGRAMPRILVVMDEFQTLFNEDHDRVAARECAVLLADFVSLSRAYGIHFLLSTQTLSRLRTGSFSVAQSTLDEIHVRIGLQCSQGEAERLFGEVYGKDASAKMGTQKGCGVYTENDLKAPPVAFRSVFCSKEERTFLLSEVEARYSAIEPLFETQVFRSSTIPDIQECPGFNSPYPNAAVASTPIFLGEPVKIAPSVTLNINRLKRSTLLVAGSDHQMLDGIVASYIFSALRAAQAASAHQSESNCKDAPCVYLCDGLSVVGQAVDDSVMRVVAGHSDMVKLALSNSAVLEFIDELYALMLQRRTKNSGIANDGYNTIHFVVNEFQWLDAFMAVYERRDYSYSDAEATDSGGDCSSVIDGIMASVSSVGAGGSRSRLEKLEELLLNGYSCGINVVASSSDFAAVKDRIYDLVPKLQNKVVFALNGEDADRIVHGALSQIEAIRSNMALFSDGVSAPYVFKPYRISVV